MRRIFPILLATLTLVGCSSLPSSLRDEIAKENDKLEQARKDVARAETTIKDSLAKVPDLFNGTAVATEWPARLAVAKSKLDKAEAPARPSSRLPKPQAARRLPALRAWWPSSIAIVRQRSMNPLP